MELVSPNTKNFLFLTMSQYNDTNDMQRARVSMRRDQAFWQGGNSFLACEGFRISASPNPGGLYYKRVSDNYFIGTERQEFVNNAAVNAGVTRTIDGNQKVAAGLQADLSTVDDKDVVEAEGEFKLELGMNNGTVGTKSRLADPDLINLCWDRFSQQLKDASLLQLAWGGNPTDQRFQLRSVGRRQRGPGAGPAQNVLLRSPAQAFTDDALSGFAAWGANNPFDMTVRVSGKIDLDSLARSFGRGAGLSPTGDKAGPNGLSVNRFQSVLNDHWPLFEVMGPKNLLLEGVPADFYDGAKQTRKAYWDELVVGGWVHLDSPTGPRYKVRAFSPLFTNVTDTGFDLNVCVKRNAQAMGEVYTSKPAPGVFPGTNADWSKVLLNNTGVTLHFQSNVADGWTSPGDGFQHVVRAYSIDDEGDQEEVDLSAADVGQVQFFQDNWSRLRTVERKADPDHYFYTPNEFFEFFNRSPSSTDSPYNLNTDTNGGFVVEWKGTTTPTNFIISEEMCTALGLLGYFEFAEVVESNTGKGWQYRLQLVNRSSTDSNPVDVVLPADQLYLDDAGARGEKLDPSDAPSADPDRQGVPFLVWDAHGTQYNVLDRFTQTEQDEAYVWTKRYPSTHVNDRGDRYYLFHNMPSVPAIMRNDQQVSIESYGTFCEINIVIPNLPFQPMLGSQTDSRILASLRIPFTYGTSNDRKGAVTTTESDYYGDLLYNSDSSRSYLKITTDQQLYDVDVEARLIRRDGSMEVFQIPPTGQFQIKLRFLQTQ